MTSSLRKGVASLAVAALAIAALPSDLHTPTAAAAVSAKELGALPLVHDAAISPDGKHLAIFGNTKGTPSLLILDASTGQPTGKGFRLGKDLKPGSVFWANDGRVLATVWTTNDYQGVAYNTSATYTFDTETGKGDWLISKKKSRRIGSNIGSGDFVYEFNYADFVDFLPDDPDHVLMQFADERTGVRSVHKVNVETGAYDTVERATTSIQDWVTDTTGAVRVAVGLRRNATEEEDVNIRIKDVDGEWKSLKHWPGLDHETRFFGFTKDPAEMVIGAYQGRDTIGMYIYDLRQKKVTRKLYHNDQYDVARAVRDRETRDVIGAHYTGEEGMTALFGGHERAFDRMTAQFDDYQVRYLDSSDGGDTLLFRVAQPYDPGALMMVRKGQATPTRLTEMRPGLNPDEFGLVVPVRYTARDGEKIPAFVTLPPTVNDTAGIKKLPFIVLPHGGPYARDSKRFDDFAQLFATRGYGVLQMNFRGSTGYGKSFAQAGRQNWSTMREDAVDGAKWLVEKGYADPERMCIAGWSFGGYSALLSGVKDPEMFKCVVAVASLSDLEGELADMRYYRNRTLARRFITDGFESKADMRDNSPVRVADQMTLPTFIAHGTLDVNVDYDQHKRLHRALKKSPAKVTEMTFKNDDHYMSVEANRQALFEGIDKFLVKVNGPSEFAKK